MREELRSAGSDASKEVKRCILKVYSKIDRTNVEDGFTNGRNIYSNFQEFKSNIIKSIFNRIPEQQNAISIIIENLKEKNHYYLTAQPHMGITETLKIIGDTWKIKCGDKVFIDLVLEVQESFYNNYKNNYCELSRGRLTQKIVRFIEKKFNGKQKDKTLLVLDNLYASICKLHCTSSMKVEIRECWFDALETCCKSGIRFICGLKGKPNREVHQASLTNKWREPQTVKSLKDAFFDLLPKDCSDVCHQDRKCRYCYCDVNEVPNKLADVFDHCGHNPWLLISPLTHILTLTKNTCNEMDSAVKDYYRGNTDINRRQSILDDFLFTLPLYLDGDYDEQEVVELKEEIKIWCKKKIKRTITWKKTNAPKILSEKCSIESIKRLFIDTGLLTCVKENKYRFHPFVKYIYTNERMFDNTL